jgi:transposase-like protein
MMHKFPNSPDKLENWFSSEEACRQHLFDIRWPQGFRCPSCQHDKAWKTKRGLYSCSNSKCNSQTSVTTGTIFHRSRKPLQLWFRAIWYVTSPYYGANALELQRILGFGSYRTAWEWLHKLRRTMGSLQKDRLSGVVEVYKAHIGNQKGGTSKEALVVIAAEYNERLYQKGICYFRLERVSDASAQNIIGFIKKNIKAGSTVRTDTWSGYNNIQNEGYHHKAIPIDKTTGESPLPLTHSVISKLKKWLQDTYKGAVGPSHLDFYLDEYTFKFSRPWYVVNHTCLFNTFMEQAVAVDPLHRKKYLSGLIHFNQVLPKHL